MLRSSPALLVASALVAAPPVAGAADDPFTAAAAGPRLLGAAPQFSDPLWLPVRNKAWVSCVRTNCRKAGRASHGFWAIDFLGDRGDPIYSAGYGIAHIGAVSTGCATGKRKRGNWVWVDHGAGEVTVYFHLDSIAITGGQPVTPATMLGRMGTTGTCGTDYLHFERRRGGLHGKYLYPAAGAACLRGQPRLLPQALGYGNWDRLPYPKRRAVKSHGVACTVAPQGIAAPTGLVVVNRTESSAQLQWNAGAPGTKFAILYEPFRKRTQEWRRPKFQYTNRTRVVVRGLQRHWTYRFRLAIDGPVANSPWTEPVVVSLR